jgi:hypothetical protein
MFNQPLLFIDSVQNAKKQFVEKYIRNQDIRNDMIIYIDAQSKFLHSALEATSGIISTCGRELFQTKVEKLFNPFSIDWHKAGWDAWIAQNRAEQKPNK